MTLSYLTCTGGKPRADIQLLKVKALVDNIQLSLCNAKCVIMHSRVEGLSSPAITLLSHIPSHVQFSLLNLLFVLWSLYRTSFNALWYLPSFLHYITQAGSQNSAQTPWHDWESHCTYSRSKHATNFISWLGLIIFRFGLPIQVFTISHCQCCLHMCNIDMIPHMSFPACLRNLDSWFILQRSEYKV